MSLPIKSPTSGIRDVIDTYKVKLESGILPPDPARVVEIALRIPPTVEHLLPVPPLIEYIHQNVTTPVVESLPRLPMTSEAPVSELLKWVKEEFRI